MIRTNRSLSRRQFLQGVVGLGVAASLAACTPPSAPAPAAEEAAAETEAIPTPQVEVMGSGRIELNMWDGIGASDGLILTEMIKGFAAENPDISVKRQIMPWNVYFDKLAAAVVAGSGGPDLFVLWHSVMPQYAKAGHLLPAAEEMFDLGMLPKDDFLPQLLEAVTVDGHMWTVPFDNYGVGVYLNVSLLEKAGIDPAQPPQDAAQWLEYARALTWDKSGKHPGDAGFDPQNVDTWGWMVDWPRATVQPALYQWGADIISRDDDPKPLINSEGAIEATQFFVDAIFTHYVAPRPAGFNVSEAFANNKIAMWPMGSWMYNWFAQHPDIKAAMWPYPRLGPERGATIMWSHTFAMPKGLAGDKLDANRKLVKYLSDNSNIWTEKAGMPCARLSKRAGLMEKVWTLPVFDKQFKAEGVMEFASPKFSEIMGAVEPEWSAAFNQDKTVREALDAAAERIQRALTA